MPASLKDKLLRAAQRPIAALFQIGDLQDRLETLTRLQSYTIDRLNQECADLRSEVTRLQEKLDALAKASGAGTAHGDPKSS